MPVPSAIVIDDDDDDVHILSPRSFAQTRSTVSLSRQRSRTVESSTAIKNQASTEDLLTLRLGRSDFGQSTSARIGGTWHQITPKPCNQNIPFMIDLTRQSPSYDADCILVNKFVQKKRKPAPVVSEPLPPEPVKELKLTCAICMDPKTLFIYADIDKCEQETHDVRYTPTFRFYRDGDKVDEFYGAGPQRLRDRLWLHS